MLDTLLAYPQSWFGPTWPAVGTLVKIVCIVVPLTIAWILVLGIWMQMPLWVWWK